MNLKIKKSLFDIKNVIESIDDYLGKQTDFNTFTKNKLLRRAIEREIEIIGEATKRILNVDPHFKISNSREIIDTRNWISHGYDKVDETILWGIITFHLPKLLQEVNHYLNK
ncbi:MAG TPA: DUF86 domain-containing protein [Leeuwenhoekiella sp.]|nr:DUF86 domain-containing protein [Leeuwenhoekiella sp.]